MQVRDSDGTHPAYKRCWQNPVEECVSGEADKKGGLENGEQFSVGKVPKPVASGLVIAIVCPDNSDR